MLSAAINPNWKAYLIHPTYLAWLRTQSTHWRATCRYDTDGVVYTDYMRTSLANCDIITLPEGTPPNICFQFEFINIRGHECFNCTAPLWNSPALHTDSGLTFCEFNATEGAVVSEDNFGSIPLQIRYTAVLQFPTLPLSSGWEDSKIKSLRVSAC